MDMFGQIARDLRGLTNDIDVMVNNEHRKRANKEKEKKGQQTEEIKERRVRSLQQITTFYSSKEEAIFMQEHPIIAFVDKRLKEIFG